MMSVLCIVIRPFEWQSQLFADNLIDQRDSADTIRLLYAFADALDFLQWRQRQIA